jgi:hypothetical protein
VNIAKVAKKENFLFFFFRAKRRVKLVLNPAISINLSNILKKHGSQNFHHQLGVSRTAIGARTIMWKDTTEKLNLS